MKKGIVKKKISVIIPVYNAEEYLEDLLNDLCLQTYADMEILIINDGSTDSSWDIICKHMREDKRINAVSVENGGPSKARNIGLDMAEGEYIRFVDADDRLPYDSMEQMINVFLVNDDIDLVLGNYICEPMKNYFLGDVFAEGFVEPERFVCHFIKFLKSFYYGVPWNKLYRKEIIDYYNIRFNEKIIWCEDFLFNVDYFEKCRAMYYINLKNGVYKYCIHESGITGELVDKKKAINFKEISSLRYEKAKKYCAKYGMEDLFDSEWKFASLYDELSAATKKKYSRSFRKRYREFKRLLSQDGVYCYVYVRQEDFDMKVWKEIKYAIEKQRYLKPFLFFWVKGYMVTYFDLLMPLLRKYFQPILPKSL